MTSTQLRISTPVDMIRAVPYLLGFHPTHSVVLVGLHDKQLVVTARLDIIDLTPATALDTFKAMQRGGTSIVMVIFFDDLMPEPGSSLLPHELSMATVTVACEEVGLKVQDGLYVADGQRFWSYLCHNTSCCPPEGKALPMETVEIEADLAAQGVSPLTDRSHLARRLTPTTPVPFVENAEATIEEYIAAAQETEPIEDERLSRLALALHKIPLRDQVWLAVDDKRLVGIELWLDMARRVPTPANVPALFLAGWETWRAGEGAFAGVILDRLLASNKDYTAARLLFAAVAHGIAPTAMPPLTREELWSIPRALTAMGFWFKEEQTA